MISSHDFAFSVSMFGPNKISEGVEATPLVRMFLDCRQFYLSTEFMPTVTTKTLEIRITWKATCDQAKQMIVLPRRNWIYAIKNASHFQHLEATCMHCWQYIEKNWQEPDHCQQATTLRWKGRELHYFMEDIYSVTVVKTRPAFLGRVHGKNLPFQSQKNW